MSSGCYIKSVSLFHPVMWPATWATWEELDTFPPQEKPLWFHWGSNGGVDAVLLSVALELQNSALFGLFSWILSASLSHKTLLLTGSSTSTLPPPLHIQPTFFFPMSISLLNKWHLFSWPRHRKARYFSLTPSADLCAAPTLPTKNKAKQKFSNTSSVQPPTLLLSLRPRCI